MASKLHTQTEHQVAISWSWVCDKYGNAKRIKRQIKYIEKTLKKELAVKDKMTHTAQLLFNNERDNSMCESRVRRYSDNIRTLAINLSFYSNPGYEKLRTICKLPSPSIFSSL